MSVIEILILEEKQHYINKQHVEPIISLANRKEVLRAKEVRVSVWSLIKGDGESPKKITENGSEEEMNVV
ncbi:hypothetical protein RIR_jg20115.t1 [Rhizophagus irregularis DAOM 181602=DAOM 197198]|nr:hypothetical protein RIR_jg20115.t1 [Rhizophagus irregularis DAOM 181602=DAOM 197198]